MVLELDQVTWRIAKMNDMTVGMENLPNVFIDKIEVSSANDPSIVFLSVIFCVYDRKPPFNSWRGRDDIDLKLHIAFEYRPEVFTQLESGIISLYDRDAPEEPSYKNHVKNNFANSYLSGEYDKFTIKVDTSIEKKPNLNIYAACFVDGLDFGNPMLNKYYGPMVGERIYVGGQLNSTTHYFYYPDTNEEYAGPVHQKEDGSFMEGSVHTDTPHKEVRLVTEENYKIVEVATS